MKTAVGRFVVAVALFAAGVACWAEGAAIERIADARQRLATLRFDTDGGLEDATSVTDRLPGRTGSLGKNVRRHRALVGYWTSRYDEVTAPPIASGPEGNAEADGATDPELLLVAANAAFRSTQRAHPDQQTAINKLDDVLQAYAGVLKTVQRHPDAAYNYEFVARVRDIVASGRPMPAANGEQMPEEAASDLPSGRTAHGRPGGPPAGARMDQFEVVTPKRGDERGSEPDSNPAKRPPRRG